nr:hypothetical protein [Rhodopirellula sp. SM50]
MDSRSEFSNLLATTVQTPGLALSPFIGRTHRKDRNVIQSLGIFSTFRVSTVPGGVQTDGEVDVVKTTLSALTIAMIGGFTWTTPLFSN